MPTIDIPGHRGEHPVARAAAAATGLLAACAVLASGLIPLPARSAEPPAARGAVAASLAEGEEIVGPEAGPRRLGAGATPRLQVPVRRGESLDAVIRRSLSELPFKEAFLRQAVMDLNPGVFRAGAATRLREGTVLQLPSLQDLCLKLGVAPAASSPSAGSTSRAADPVRPGDPPGGALDERRRWVRFP